MEKRQVEDAEVQGGVEESGKQMMKIKDCTEEGERKTL